MNKIICADAADGLATLPDGFVPFTLTSPPYDGIRIFGGHPWNFEVFRQIAQQLYRVTAPGGVVVWVVQDQIIEGSHSGSSFRQALYFRWLGFRLHESIILLKRASRFTPTGHYDAPPEYAFVFAKGRPGVFHPIRDRANKYPGLRCRKTYRLRDGTLVRDKTYIAPTHGKRRFVWQYNVGFPTVSTDHYAYAHPALMSEQIAEDLILSWSNPGALVLDPMCGAGTSLKMALLNDRFCLGFDIHRPYCDLAERRLRDAGRRHRERLDEVFRRRAR